MYDRNCEGTVPDDQVVTSYPWAPELRQCPRAAVDDLAWEWLDLYACYKMSGSLPFPGDWGAQPAYVGQAFEIIAAAQYRQEAREAARTRALMEQAARGGGGHGV